MKIIILAGGLGTRISEQTKTQPKPMVKIGRYPILIHIIKHYLDFGFNDFIIAGGYKIQALQKYFKNFKRAQKAFKFKLKNKYCTINIVNTGKFTMTGGRIRRIKPFIKKDENFMFTYGDGVSNVNLKKLLKFFKKSKKMVTVTAVRPPARFGEIIIKKNLAISFKEKPQVSDSWINGGFFVANYKFFNFLKNDKDILEKKPLELVCKKKQLSVFCHHGYWKCMDTVRDRHVLIKQLKGKDFLF